VCHKRGSLQNQSESSFGQASTPCLIEFTTSGRKASVSLLSQALFSPRPLLLCLQLSTRGGGGTSVSAKVQMALRLQDSAPAVQEGPRLPALTRIIATDTELQRGKSTEWQAFWARLAGSSSERRITTLSRRNGARVGRVSENVSPLPPLCPNILREDKRDIRYKSPSCQSPISQPASSAGTKLL
jgi:hypothetical protein